MVATIDAYILVRSLRLNLTSEIPVRAGGGRRKRNGILLPYEALANNPNDDNIQAKFTIKIKQRIDFLRQAHAKKDINRAMMLTEPHQKYLNKVCAREAATSAFIVALKTPSRPDHPEDAAATSKLEKKSFGLHFDFINGNNGRKLIAELTQRATNFEHKAWDGMGLTHEEIYENAQLQLCSIGECWKRIILYYETQQHQLVKTCGNEVFQPTQVVESTAELDELSRTGCTKCVDKAFTNMSPAFKFSPIYGTLFLRASAPLDTSIIISQEPLPGVMCWGHYKVTGTRARHCQRIH